MSSLSAGRSGAWTAGFPDDEAGKTVWSFRCVLGGTTTRCLHEAVAPVADVSQAEILGHRPQTHLALPGHRPTACSNASPHPGLRPALRLRSSPVAKHSNRGCTSTITNEPTAPSGALTPVSRRRGGRGPVRSESFARTARGTSGSRVDPCCALSSGQLLSHTTTPAVSHKRRSVTAQSRA